MATIDNKGFLHGRLGDYVYYVMRKKQVRKYMPKWILLNLEEPLYLINESKNVVIRTEMDDKQEPRAYIKPKGKAESEVDQSVVTLEKFFAEQRLSFISKEEYDVY